MNVRRAAAGVVSALLATLFVFVSTTTAQAVPPLASLDGLITDQTNSMADRAVVDEAQANFEAATGGQFYVVFVESFDGMNVDTWAENTAVNAGLGPDDILLAVSPSDQAYSLQAGTGLSFTDAQIAELEGVMANSLNAGLDGVTSWAEAVANIVGAFQNQIASTPDAGATEAPAPAETPTQPPGTVNDSPVVTETVTEAPTVVTEATSGGMPTALRVVLIVVGVLAALFAIWLLLGKYNEKRLAKRAEQNPFNLQ
ncbi:MAG: TPM domain-containing protein [Promicromonosporaceae bacterium]|nr:TPM domain-containing protein [Promicromonosporaceae bacterium]